MENKYELIALFPPKMNDVMAEKTLADLVKSHGFMIAEVDKWGIKPLVYPIKKETKAYYLRLVISGGDAKSLSVALKNDESMLRYLLVKLSAKASADKPAKTVAGKEK